MSAMIKTISNTRRDEGLALPLALLLVLVISAVGAIYSQTSIQNLAIMKLDEATSDTFYVAEGAVHNLLRQMTTSPHLWREKVTLSDTPASYTEYTPLTYVSQNGIPTCSGSVACQRNLYPTGGGIIKNIGPIGGAGETVNNTYIISEQLDPLNPPASDVTLNARDGWVQVERLDELLPGASNMGGELTNNPQGGTQNKIRFRVTGSTLRKVKTRNGQSTVVVIVELS